MVSTNFEQLSLVYRIMQGLSLDEDSPFIWEDIIVTEAIAYAYCYKAAPLSEARGLSSQSKRLSCTLVSVAVGQIAAFLRFFEG